MLILRTVSNISNACLAELLVGLMVSLMEKIITPKTRHVVKLYLLVVDLPLVDNILLMMMVNTNGYDDD